MVEFRGRQYELIRASDIERDGMWLELYDLTANERPEVLDAFYSDATGEMSFTANAPDLPFELVEWFVARARELLPPRAAAETGPATERRGSRPPA
jgi:hypothetical protein